MLASSGLSAERQGVAGARHRPAVTIVTRPLWRLRLGYELPRYLLYATCALGLLASARFAIAPPRPAAPVRAAPAIPQTDLAARGYATLFARRYLTWDTAQPQLREAALASMIGPALDQDAGLTPPSSGAQHVLWAEAVQERSPARGRNVFTVAAQTDASGLVYLTVTVVRGADRRLSISGYPAFVGAPLSAPGQPEQAGAEVGDPALAAVVERALRNYLASSPQELGADLAEHAQVALPEASLTLVSTQRLAWSTDRRSVVAVVEAQDARGARYTLGYEVDVERIDGRWEVSAIQTEATE